MSGWEIFGKVCLGLIVIVGILILLLIIWETFQGWIGNMVSDAVTREFEYRKALENAKPGDVIRRPNGWSYHYEPPSSN